MIAITPLIAPLAAKIGGGRAIALGFLLAAIGFGALAFVQASWAYGAFVLPLVGLAVGLGIANGPASSGSTSSVAPEQVGQASGISNMARYIGGSVAVAAAAMVSNAVTVNHKDAGESAGDALAAGLGAASLMMAIWCAAGIALVVLLRRHHAGRVGAAQRAAAATAAFHTIPIQRSADAG
jgi:MFS family permease